MAETRTSFASFPLLHLLLRFTGNVHDCSRRALFEWPLFARSCVRKQEKCGAQLPFSDKDKIVEGSPGFPNKDFGISVAPWRLLWRLHDFDIYDPTSDSWEVGPPLPVRRAWLGATLLNGCIYVMGGAYRKNDRVNFEWLNDMYGLDVS